MTHTRGGARPGSGRKPGFTNPNAGRRPRNPAGPKVTVNLRLDPDLHRHVTEYATTQGITLSQAISELLKERIDHNVIL
jgi:predicted HicB family RNase H-like nuclease